jgi:hypothetical protein
VLLFSAEKSEIFIRNLGLIVSEKNTQIRSFSSLILRERNRAALTLCTEKKTLLSFSLEVLVLCFFFDGENKFVKTINVESGDAREDFLTSI